VTAQAERVIIGRGPRADLVIDDASVSPTHCEICREPGYFVLRDLGSDRGTWLRGVRVREVVLPTEASIGVGDSEIVFSLVERASEPGPFAGRRFGELIGESKPMRSLFARLARAAARDTTLLLTGQSGTGKELAARAVHEASSRSHAPFVVVDSGSVQPAQAERELFGGARNGESSCLGAFVRAQGGTLFLDEVAELDAEVQRRLLRVLEERQIPVGGGEPVPLDVRIIAATQRDLQPKLHDGEFRDDLYYRLAVTRVRLPALRERPSDIPLLIEHFLEQFSRRDGTSYGVNESVAQQLALRPWPGNVRELKNAVEQILAFGSDEIEHLDSTAPASGLHGPGEHPSGAVALPFKVAKARVLERFEREYLTSVLERHGGNITAAALAAEVDRVHFLRLLDRYGMRKTRNRPG
jgi:DNA-binding NtrC family response regulator